MNMRKLLCNILHFEVTRSEKAKKEKEEEHPRQRGKPEQSHRGGRAQGVEGRKSTSRTFTEFSMPGL